MSENLGDKLPLVIPVLAAPAYSVLRGAVGQTAGMCAATYEGWRDYKPKAKLVTAVAGVAFVVACVWALASTKPVAGSELPNSAMYSAQPAATTIANPAEPQGQFEKIIQYK